MPKPKTGRRIPAGPAALAVLLLLAGTQPTPAQHVETTIGVGRGPLAMVLDTLHRKVYVANEGGNSVTVINAESNSVVATIPVGLHPSAVCWNAADNKVYVANNDLNGPGTATVICSAGDTVIATVAVGRGPTGLVWNNTRNKVYCLNRDARSMTVIDGRTNGVLKTIGLQQNLNGVIYSPATDRVYACSGAYGQPGKVHVIDCGSDELVTSVNSGSNAWSLAYGPARNRLYVANAGSGNMSVINCTNNQSLAVLPAGEEPRCVIWTTPNKVFCSVYWSRVVRFMHGDSLRFRGAADLAGSPENMLYNPGTQKLFVACPLASQVAVIDARDGHEHQVLKTLDVGGGPKPMVVYPGQSRVYVGNSWDTTVTVIKDVVGIEEPRHAPHRIADGLLSPNPARTTVTLAGADPVRLYDRTGSIAAELQPGKNLLAHLDRGVYFARDRHGTLVGKLVKLD